MPDAEGDAGRDRRRLEGIDLVRRHHDRFVETVAIARAQNGIADDPGRAVGRDIEDRKSVVEGKRVEVRVDLGGRRISKKKTNIRYHQMLKIKLYTYPKR